MRRSCRVVRNLSESGDRRTSTLRREYRAAFPLSHAVSWARPHSSFTTYLSTGTHVLRSGLTLTFFSKGIPRTESITPCVRLSSVFDARCRSLSCSYLVGRPFPGDFFTAAFQCPHRVGRVGTLGDGGKWVCGLDRVARQRKCVIYSFGLSISTLSTPQ